MSDNWEDRYTHLDFNGEAMRLDDRDDLDNWVQSIEDVRAMAKNVGIEVPDYDWLEHVWSVYDDGGLKIMAGPRDFEVSVLYYVISKEKIRPEDSSTVFNYE